MITNSLAFLSMYIINRKQTLAAKINATSNKQTEILSPI